MIRAAISLFVLLAGCATSNPIVLSGPEAVRYEKDVGECRAKIEGERAAKWDEAKKQIDSEDENKRLNDPRSNWQIFQAWYHRDDLVKKCMEGKGWLVVN